MYINTYIYIGVSAPFLGAQRATPCRRVPRQDTPLLPPRLNFGGGYVWVNPNKYDAYDWG